MSVQRTLAVLCTLSLGTLAGCAGGADSETTTSPARSSTARTPSPSASRTPTTNTTTSRQGSAEQNAVREAVVGFSRLTDELATHPKASLDKLATVSRGKSNAQWTQIVTNYRRKGWKQVGSTSVEVTAVRPQEGSSFSVRACLDVSKVNLIDKYGKSVVAASRPPRVAYAYTVQKAGSDYFITKDKALRTC